MAEEEISDAPAAEGGTPELFAMSVRRDLLQGVRWPAYILRRQGRWSGPLLARFFVIKYHVPCRVYAK